MSSAVQDLVFAAFLCNATVAGGECEDWARRAGVLLKTWFLDTDTQMLPNLYYGQISPRASPPIVKGHGGFIEWTDLPRLLDHVQLLRYSYPSVWTEADHNLFTAWVTAFNDYVDGKEARGERDMENNHGTWYDNTWHGVAFFAGNMTDATAAATEVNQRRITQQVKSDGKQWIELERTNPAGYCIYNLQAYANNADQAKNTGGAVNNWDFVSTEGGSIRKALDFLLPFATGGQPWPYPQIEPPAWSGLFETLRRASIAYQSRAYEVAACQVVKAAAAISWPPAGGSWLQPVTRFPRVDSVRQPLQVQYGSDPLDLYVPAIYAVTC